MEMNGYPMLRVCPNCKGLIDDEISDCGTCTCDDEELLGYGEDYEGFNDDN